MRIPTLTDVYAARERVYRVVRPTPLMAHPLLTAETGVEIRVKHENHNPTGAFKVRGGVNLVASLSADDRRGVVTATTGNHGQSIALACQREGVPCTIVVPSGNNPEKNAAMRAFGATLIESGRDFDEARERAEQLQHERALRYVHSANEPLLIAGVGTYALEIFEEQPDTDVILVPIGGGSGASGCCIVRTGLGRRARIIGVQAARADAFSRSWRSGHRVVGEADGVEILEERLDDLLDRGVKVRRDVQEASLVVHTELVVLDDELAVLDHVPRRREHLLLVVVRLVDRDVGVRPDAEVPLAGEPEESCGPRARDDRDLVERVLPVEVAQPGVVERLLVHLGHLLLAVLPVHE